MGALEVAADLPGVLLMLLSLEEPVRRSGLTEARSVFLMI